MLTPPTPGHEQLSDTDSDKVEMEFQKIALDSDKNEQLPDVINTSDLDSMEMVVKSKEPLTDDDLEDEMIDHGIADVDTIDSDRQSLTEFICDENVIAFEEKTEDLTPLSDKVHKVIDASILETIKDGNVIQRFSPPKTPNACNVDKSPGLIGFDLIELDEQSQMLLAGESFALKVRNDALRRSTFAY